MAAGLRGVGTVGTAAAAGRCRRVAGCSTAALVAGLCSVTAYCHRSFVPEIDKIIISKMEILINFNC